MIQNFFIFIQRSIAYVIDYIIITIFQMPLAFIFDITLISGFNKENLPIYLAQLLLFIILLFGFFTIHFLYFAYCYEHWGTSIGKRLFNLAVTNDSGKKLTYEETFKRELTLKILLFFIPFTGIMMIFRKDQKMLHDVLAKQKVFKINPSWLKVSYKKFLTDITYTS